MPYLEPSRPSPDCFTPPNGAISLARCCRVDADDAALERLGHAPHARHVARIEVRRQAELGVVRHARSLRLILERDDRRHRARTSPRFVDLHRLRDPRHHRRLVERAAEAASACRRARSLPPFSRHRPHAPRPWPTARSSISGPMCDPVLRAPAELQAPALRRRTSRRTPRRRRSCT